MAQNPDVTLARLDEENARHGVQVAKDPFSPRIVVGSGLAYSNGFPMSIEGSAPSIVQARCLAVHLQSPAELPGGAGEGTGARRGLDVANKRDEVAYRTASLTWTRNAPLAWWRWRVRMRTACRPCSPRFRRR